MSRPFLLLVYIAVFFYSAPSFAAWYLHQPQATDKEVVLTDDESEFNLEEIKCGVTATQFVRGSDDSILETRELYCWTDKETRVSVWGNCQKSLFQSVTLQIKREGRSYLPQLICGPKK
jgi:hypothetical protein